MNSQKCGCIIDPGRGGRGAVSKGEMIFIVTISWIAGLVILALVFTLIGVKPSDLPRWFLVFVWLAVSKIIHALLIRRKEK